MKIVLRALKDQIIVITGATNGIGIATARMAAKEGARIVAAARNEEALNQLTEEINNMGGKAVYVKADVGREEDVARIADTAIRAYGTFDTWINNADSLTPGGCLDVSTDDMKRMVDTNFWGVVYGSRVAAKHYVRRNEAGAIINVSSFEEETSTARQGAYAISKHAVYEWTNALRAELEKEKHAVSVSLIHLGKEVFVSNKHALAPTENQSEAVENANVSEGAPKAILHCAQKPKRDVYVNTQSKFFTVLDSLKPRFTDKANAADLKAEGEFFQNTKSPSTIETIDIDNTRNDQQKAKRSVMSSLLLAAIGAGIWVISKRKNNL